MDRGGLKFYRRLHALSEAEKRIHREFDMIGRGVLDALRCLVYDVRGYYAEWTARIEADYKEEWNCKALPNVIKACIREGIFDRTLYEKYGILTSLEIQEYYVFVRKSAPEFVMEEKYLLMSPTLLPKNCRLNGEKEVKTEEKRCSSAGKKEKVKRLTISILKIHSESDKEALSRLQEFFDKAEIRLECDRIIEEHVAIQLIKAIKNSRFLQSAPKTLSWFETRSKQDNDKRTKLEKALAGFYEDVSLKKEKDTSLRAPGSQSPLAQLNKFLEESDGE